MIKNTVYIYVKTKGFPSYFFKLYIYFIQVYLARGIFDQTPDNPLLVFFLKGGKGSFFFFKDYILSKLCLLAPSGLVPLNAATKIHETIKEIKDFFFLKNKNIRKGDRKLAFKKNKIK